MGGSGGCAWEDRVDMHGWIVVGAWADGVEVHEWMGRSG